MPINENLRDKLAQVSSMPPKDDTAAIAAKKIIESLGVEKKDLSPEEAFLSSLETAKKIFSLTGYEVPDIEQIISQEQLNLFYDIFETQNKIAKNDPRFVIAPVNRPYEVARFWKDAFDGASKNGLIKSPLNFEINTSEPQNDAFNLVPVSPEYIYGNGNSMVTVRIIPAKQDARKLYMSERLRGFVLFSNYWPSVSEYLALQLSLAIDGNELVDTESATILFDHTAWVDSKIRDDPLYGDLNRSSFTAGSVKTNKQGETTIYIDEKKREDPILRKRPAFCF